MSRCLSRICLALLLLMAPCLSEEILQLHLQLTENGQEPQPVLVSLAGEMLEYETVGRRVRYDFKERRALVATSDSVESLSLYSDIGFRVAELQNRLRWNQALDSADIDTEGFQSTPLQLENLFGIEAPNAPEPQVDENEDSVELSDQEQLLFRFQRGGQELTPNQSEQFVRFIRYFTGGHPDALDMLKSEQVVPKSFTVVQPSVDGETVRRFQFVESHKIEKLEPFPAMNPPLSSELDKLLIKASSLSVKEIADRHISVEQRALDLLDSEQYFLATLAFLEATLNTGQPMAREFSEAQDRILEDKRVSVLLKAMSPRQKDRVDASITILESLKKEAGESEHVLTVFQGSLYLGAKRAEESRSLLLPALEKYPAMSTVWKDLGEAYYQDFQTVQAWNCWDTGRSLAPENSHYKDIETLEQLLEISYPGFF